MRALSARLEAVLELLQPCLMLVDVGTDHGLIPISAVRRGIAARAIAADLRRPPLLQARRNISAARLTHQILVLRQDGLTGLANGRVDAVVMAGMGGVQMAQLLSQAPHALENVSQLVLQPNGDAVVMRRYALEHGWHLREESMLIERGQFFVTCAFQRGSGTDTSYQLAGWNEADLCLVGPRLRARRDATALRFYEWQCRRLGVLVERDVFKMESELSIWQAARTFAQSVGERP